MSTLCPACPSSGHVAADLMVMLAAIHAHMMRPAARAALAAAVDAEHACRDAFEQRGPAGSPLLSSLRALPDAGLAALREALAHDRQPADNRQPPADDDRGYASTMALAAADHPRAEQASAHRRELARRAEEALAALAASLVDQPAPTLGDAKALEQVTASAERLAQVAGERIDQRLAELRR